MTRTLVVIVKKQAHNSYRVFVGDETKASGSVSFPVKHDNRVCNLTKLRKELLKLSCGDCYSYEKR